MFRHFLPLLRSGIYTRCIMNAAIYAADRCLLCCLGEGCKMTLHTDIRQVTGIFKRKGTKQPREHRCRRRRYTTVSAGMSRKRWCLQERLPVLINHFVDDSD